MGRIGLGVRGSASFQKNSAPGSVLRLGLYPAYARRVNRHIA